MTSETNLIRHFPHEVTEICIRYFVEGARERDPPRNSNKEIAPLRLVCKDFRDIVSGDLFGHLKLHFYPEQSRAKAFLDIVRKRNDILKHIRDLSIEFPPESIFSSSRLLNTVTGLVDILAKAPFTTLTVTGLNRHSASVPLEYSAILRLRCAPNLENLVVSGDCIPAFLVCGTIGSAALKSIKILGDSSPFHEVDGSSAFEEGSMILAKGFQPLVKLEHLSIDCLTELPDYFPLHDFGSAHYPSNRRIPARFPSLKTLRAGDSESFALEEDDYEALATLLSLAPQLEELSIVDGFSDHDVFDDLYPLLQQLHSMTHLKHLTLQDTNTEELNSGDVALSAFCGLITRIPAPVPALETLSLRLRWPSVHPDTTRFALYFSKGWNELCRVLVRSTLASLRHLVLYIDIEGIKPDLEFELPSRESLGPEELEGLEEMLTKGMSQVLRELGSKLQVKVVTTFRAW